MTNNQQNIEAIAEFAGFEYEERTTCETCAQLVTFNPYESWEDCMDVEQVIQEDGKGELCKKYLAKFDSKAHYISCDQKERMDYFVSIITPNKNE